MKVISSQKYIDDEILNEKIEQIRDLEYIELPIINVEMQDEDGNDLFVLIDGHHRKEAAQQLGIDVRYEEVPNYHNLTGVELLNAIYMDSDYYYVDTGADVW